MTSLRSRVKQGPPMPTQGVSVLDNVDLKAVEQETLNRKYEAQLAHYFGQEVEFEDNWVKAYGLIFETYCSQDMQVAVRELIDYDTRTIDNPLELLTDVEKLMHVPRKAVYPTLALLETISSLLTLRQQKKEGLMSYLERFKSEKNVVLGLFGKTLLDGHVENMPAYADLNSITDAADRAREQQTMKDKTLSKFFALMFLKQSDKNKYGHLLNEFRQSYANKQRDLYPENLSSMFDVMRTVEIKKAKPKSQPPKKKDDNKVQPGAESFAQTGATKKKSEDKDARCYACGKEGVYANECKIRKDIAEKDWFKKSGVEHYKTHASNHTQIAAATTNVVTGKRVGFCGNQVVTKLQSDILLIYIMAG